MKGDLTIKGPNYISNDIIPIFQGSIDLSIIEANNACA